MKRFATINLFFLAATLGCTNADKAEHVLSSAGYTEIVTGGYAMFSCSEDDTVKTSFTAKGPSDQPVSGAVCCGIAIKNCTIRLD